ncbi:hypothetical protein C942_00938 [Photobacterium marinum]|uniref:Uncharacterized protein n=1 Tax=Photobacterium marinum TaxID=1056511 RepID=L8JAP1_9GAMM|nr:hypothetical protein [Photobacterium marinum]ELR65851.1 hypothetical protein C942_00938 [Photobacterium marinum]
MKQNPFSFYDFLGYLIPGGVFTVIMSLMFTPHFFNVINEVSHKVEGGIFAGSSILVGLIVVFYIIGHLISLLSSSFVEKYLTETYGWPSKYLFSNVDAILSLSVRKYFVKLYTDVRNGCLTKKGMARKIFNHLFMGVVLFPVVAVERILNRLLGIRPSKLPKPLRIALLYKIDDFFNSSNIEINNKAVNIGYVEGDLFRFIYHSAQENSENHIPKMANYVALYGFSRNVCFVFVLIFWASLTHLNQSDWNYWYTVSFAIIASVFFYGFEKFYHRYTLEAIMACVSYSRSEN